MVGQPPTVKRPFRGSSNLCLPRDRPWLARPFKVCYATYNARFPWLCSREVIFQKGFLLTASWRSA